MHESLVTDTIRFENSKQEVFDVVIDTLTKLGRGGPEVDRLLSKVSGPIKKKQTPFRRCQAEITITEKAGISTVFIAVICEHDKEVSRGYSMDAYRQIVAWLIGPSRGLKLLL